MLCLGSALFVPLTGGSSTSGPPVAPDMRAALPSDERQWLTHQELERACAPYLSELGSPRAMQIVGWRTPEQTTVEHGQTVPPDEAAKWQPTLLAVTQCLRLFQPPFAFFKSCGDSQIGKTLVNRLLAQRKLSMRPSEVHEDDPWTTGVEWAAFRVSIDALLEGASDDAVALWRGWQARCRSAQPSFPSCDEVTVVVSDTEGKTPANTDHAAVQGADQRHDLRSARY